MKKVILIIVIIAVIAGAAGGAFLALRPGEERDRSFSYDPGEFFVTDIQDSNRLLKTDVILVLSDSREEGHYLQHNHRIRNTIIFVLRNMTEDQLMQSDIEDRLNRAIIDHLNREFDTDHFQKVYFNEFVIQ